ncbi:cytochrome f [Leptothoe spongobia]|uniref:Cytochrome f n=1 Tax=Leptothoe spongobia TAU-MAC 1115 TaxID=1967444 RepID=A0A947DFI1_9CYAN|nr:apocytochrome f [Leptothoe spongobia]MBT9316147.1 apocytochrome f [Leptothoe spongobia TAU-MAC 1115]
MKFNFLSVFNKLLKVIVSGAVVAIATMSLVLTNAQSAAAYPFWAQENYEVPREATGKLVCANCHLGKKKTEVELPQAVLPDTVFEAVVKVPYDLDSQQVLGDGSKGGLNVGALLMLPDGFTLAPDDRIPEEMKEEIGGTFYTPYSADHPNWLLVGPVPGEQYQEIIFPVLSPDPATDKSVIFGKYQVHVGGNRGRGQVYPTGQATNNVVYTASKGGIITDIDKGDYGTEVTIKTADGVTVTESLQPGPELIVSKGDAVEAGAALTNDPNVGGFGQHDTEIVLQSPNRIKGLLAFLAAASLTQIMLVLKKKQVETVQAANMTF